MPSKYGFGNTRKKSPYTKGRAHYGMDQKNPIMKKETLPGIDTSPMKDDKKIDTSDVEKMRAMGWQEKEGGEGYTFVGKPKKDKESKSKETPKYGGNIGMN